MDNIKEIVEALIFASGAPISKKDIVDKIPELTTAGLNKIIDALKEKYSGECGIRLSVFNDKLQFGTNPDYGDVLAEVLTPIKERELSKSLLEVLAIIAYRQPITRAELEEIRKVGVEYQITMLSKVNLIKIVGRKDTVGMPFLFGTTDEFLRKFQIESLDDLPDFRQVKERIALFDMKYNETRDTLYSNRKLFAKDDETPDEIIVEPNIEIPEIFLRENTNKIADDFLPEDAFFRDDDDDDDFLSGEDFETFE